MSVGGRACIVLGNDRKVGLGKEKRLNKMFDLIRETENRI